MYLMLLNIKTHQDNIMKKNKTYKGFQQSHKDECNNYFFIIYLKTI